MAKNKYVNLGILCERKKENEDDPTSYYIKLDKDVSVTIDGDDVTGGYLNVTDPLDKFDKMAAALERKLSDGKIDEAEYEESLQKISDSAERFDEGGDLSYIRQELTYVRKD